MSPVTDLLICQPGWNETSPALPRQCRLRRQRPLLDWDPLMTDSSESWDRRTKRMPLVAWCLGTPVYSTGHQTYDGTCAFLLVKTRGNILTDHKAKLSGRRIRRKERRPLVLLHMTNDTRQRQEKTVTISGCQRISRKQKYL